MKIMKVIIKNGHIFQIIHIQHIWIMFTTTLMIITQIETGKILVVFDDMIADIMTNKQFQAIIKELFIRCRKLNISLAFITQSYFSFRKKLD